ncbi:rhodanese-related sulfurtransferase [Subsaximicrobium wynnwilliamsii]|uniref:tRNA uridine(34) hydroxylase n=1 Tax=Subsaximicrobium wynnwilliamsii TaxID=291179 RepID=A0A5C6ZKF6_9FLAO|nr:rhodanese-related sulfurtransferase [Subsaximicrobium wynnwilliamsii]TXD83905.1 rhodanese-related sulfurtransferase [Subsaximicrobium wynnwilliamsii]TXD89645.1 rhodanese-related sulfurtransferase [Subsaximicrobium wynnwilliamsii]TXE02563.1 rhodanese-related sulfurtransferase [Subsaximicrobium wynnwilliamsii]
MQLYNTLSAKERAELIAQAGQERLTLSFYAYAKINAPRAFRNQLFLAWNPLEVLGRIYVAHEGINAQLSVPAEHFQDLKTHLDSIPFLEDVRINIAIEHDNFAFLKLKVKVRDKIVADGLDDDTFDVTNKGIHVDAEAFNSLMEDPNTILVDMRNHYESEIGHFKNAITPNVDTFRESLDIIEEDLKDHKEDKNLVMYCTGGIRCEKASAYYKHKGFKNVFQLEGGIIHYVRQVEADQMENKFIGKNFVFDQRRSERISDDVIAHCHQCGQPADTHVNCANDACHLLFIQCEDCQQKMENCCSSTCMEVNQLPKDEQKDMRKGQGNSNDIFKKGRAEHLSYKKDLRNIFENFQK